MDIRIKGKVTTEAQFASVLGALGAAGKSGCLVIASGEVERRIFFEDGAIVAASSSVTSESFGHVLVERAIIKSHNLANAKELGTGHDSLLGSRLVEVGALSEDDVRSAVRMKVRDTITEVLDGGGQYEFTDERLSMKDKVPVLLDPGELMGGPKVLRDGQPAQTPPQKQPKIVVEESEPIPSVAEEPTLSGSESTLIGTTTPEPTLTGGGSEPTLVERRGPNVLDRRDREVPDRRDAAGAADPSAESSDRRDPAASDRRDPAEPDRRDPTVNKMLAMFADFHLGDEASSSSESVGSEPTLTGTESTLTGTESTLTGGTIYEEPEPTIREAAPPVSESAPTLIKAQPEPIEPEAKPSTGSHARPATGSHARPATDSHARPATDSHARPATDSHARPATDSHARPATDSHARPTTGSHTRPTTGSYARPTTGSYSRPGTGVHDKPKSNAPIIGAAAAAAVVILGGGYWLFFGGSGEQPATGARLEVPRVETTPAQTDAEPQSQPPAQSTPPPKNMTPTPAPKRRQEPPRQVQQAPPKREKAPVKTAPKPARPQPVKKQVAPVKKQEAPPRPVKKQEVPPVAQAPVKAAQNVAPNPPAVSGNGGSAPPPAATTAPTAPAKTKVVSEPANPSAAEPKAEPAPASWENAVFAPTRPNAVTSQPAAPEATVVKRGDLVEPGPEVIEPVLIKHPELKLPKAAKKQKIKEMVVRVRVLVDENGNVVEAKLDKAIGNGFDESAVQMARQSRFIPATHGRVQVKMWTELPLHYRKK